MIQTSWDRSNKRLWNVVETVTRHPDYFEIFQTWAVNKGQRHLGSCFYPNAGEIQSAEHSVQQIEAVNSPF